MQKKSVEGCRYIYIYIYIYNTWIHTKFDFTVDEGKERLNPSREKN